MSSRNEILRQEGWRRQFVANEPRLSEAVEMYNEAGFHVHLEPLPKEAECESCAGGEEEEKLVWVCMGERRLVASCMLKVGVETDL